jgi:hypothetical protein
MFPAPVATGKIVQRLEKGKKRKQLEVQLDWSQQVPQVAIHLELTQ